MNRHVGSEESNLGVVARDTSNRKTESGYGGETEEVVDGNYREKRTQHMYTESQVSSASLNLYLECQNQDLAPPATPQKRHLKQQSLPVFTHQSSPLASEHSGHFVYQPRVRHPIGYIREEKEQESMQVISDLPSSDEACDMDSAISDVPEQTLKAISPYNRFGLSSTKNSGTTGADFRPSMASEESEPRWTCTLDIEDVSVPRSRTNTAVTTASDLQTQSVRCKYEATLKADRTARDCFGMLPIKAYCEHCRTDVSTRVSLELPKFARCVLVSWKGLLLTRELMSCCGDPEVLPKYQDIRHYCRRCRRLLAEVTPSN